jgi:hypothetical protein
MTGKKSRTLELLSRYAQHNTDVPMVRRRKLTRGRLLVELGPGPTPAEVAEQVGGDSSSRPAGGAAGAGGEKGGSSWR